MPAVSKAQQALFGMALAVRKGEMKRSDVDQSVLDIVDSDMTDKEIRDFAATKNLKENAHHMKSLVESILDELDDEKIDRATIDINRIDLHRELMTKRKKLYNASAVHGKDMFGNSLKVGDIVIMANYNSDSVNSVSIYPVMLVQEKPHGWEVDMDRDESSELGLVCGPRLIRWSATDDCIIMKLRNINQLK